MKICIYGLGAVGGLIGGRLALAGHEVSAIARGARVKLIRQEGLTLLCSGKSETVKINVQEDPAHLGPQDIIFITVKNTSIMDVAEGIYPLMDQHTCIVSAMNGVPWWFYHGLTNNLDKRSIDSVDPNGLVTKAIPHDKVVGCVSNLSANTPSPNTIEYKPNPKFSFGEPTGGAKTDRCLAILSAMKSAGLDAKPSESIQETIWFKLLGNMTVNPISAITGATSDKIASDPLVANFMKSCMQESLDIGSCLGLKIQLSLEDRMEETRRLGVFKTSMLQDVESGRPLELDAIVGAVREIAANVGVPTPNIDTLFGLSCVFAKTKGLYRQ